MGMRNRAQKLSNSFWQSANPDIGDARYIRLNRSGKVAIMERIPEKSVTTKDCLQHLDLLPELRRIGMAARVQGFELVDYLLGMAELSLIETRAMHAYLDDRESERPRSTSAR